MLDSAQKTGSGVMRFFALLLTASFLFGYAGTAASQGVPDPLFQATGVIPVTITGPLSELVRKRPVEEELDARFRFTDTDGTAVDAAVKLRARGNFRRQRSTCPFPPVRLNFRKGDVEKTVFHKQDKVKLVAHCRDGRSYFAAVHREYLAYQILNLLTDASFRVRLLEITWVDTDRNDRSDTHFGFIIEHKDRFGKRIDRQALEIEKTSVRELDAEYTNLASLFQLFIANTDFSPIAGPPGDVCCHNAVLMGRDGAPILPVPYDFDMSGFVDAPYSTPNPRFKLRSVKQRKYRGRCVNNRHVPDTVALFNDKRAAIESLITANAYLNEREKTETLRFVEGFYDIVNDPQKLERQVIGDCIG